MPIVYAFVATFSSRSILAEYSCASGGNHRTVVPMIVKRLDEVEGKARIAYDDNFTFNYICADGLYYMAMCDTSDSTRIPFAFLESMKAEFLKRFPSKEATMANSYTYDKAFSKNIRTLMESFNSGKEDNYNIVQSKLHEVKDVMTKNIESVLQRGEKLELLVERTEQLAEGSQLFLKRSRSLRDAMFWRRIRLYILVVLGLGIVLWLVTSAICGFDYSQC